MIEELSRSDGTLRIRRLTAPNPSPMTALGTNTYIVGSGRVAVIDPGPKDDRHLTALLGALDPGERVGAIVVTHAHRDHSALARDLAAATGAAVHALVAPPPLPPPFDLSPFGGGGEGIDRGFAPDVRLLDGETVDGDGWALRVLHTPGHLGDHICLAAGDVLFTGDHVMGWSTSIVSPPEGSMRSYRRGLALLARERWSVIHPGHGPSVTNPAGRIADLAAHRDLREADILTALADGPATLVAMTQRIYAGTHAGLMAAASRNVLAHLVELAGESRIAVTSDGLSVPTFRLS